MDNLVFEESINAEIEQSEFISKKWIYVNDINNGNYSSQIIIDSTPLANAGGYINFTEGYIAMPLVVSLYSATVDCGLDANIDEVGHTWGFRNGFWHIINSMSVEFNNGNIIQQTPFLNVFRSFKALTSFSQDDLKQGYSIGFYPDNAGSWEFIDTDNQASGKGLCNNRTAPFLQATTTATNATAITQINVTPYTRGNNPSNIGVGSQYAYNEGLAKRSEWYGYTPSVASKGQELLMTSGNCNTVFRAYRLPKPASTDKVASWSVMAKLRLKDLADFFNKCPLLKGSTMRFLINTNQTTTTFTRTVSTVSATTGVITAGVFTTADTKVVSQGLTNPLVLCSGDIGQGCFSLPAGTYTLSVSIYRDTVNNIGAGSSVPVRLYAPIYKMNPIAEQRYLSLAPTKKILYNDIFQYKFSGINSTESFNFLVSNGIPNIKSVLVVPFLSSSGNSTTDNTLLSPFTTSGATPDPVPLSNFNILVSGVNLFLNNQLYDFEQFRQELMSSNQLNGSLTTGLTSGLISEDDFSRGIRYYYGNCSRVLPSEEGVSRSVQILGQNIGPKQIDIMVFVEFQKSIEIDISTGARIQ
jgi:hypothetical protein